ncbi:hypothetical protein RB195_012415 [Necator americanus]|uniref:Uncharacterized protein n=1 Tax=Necator americanus TaxID=51031 RepID=A0ABR1D7V3_NECAM
METFHDPLLLKKTTSSPLYRGGSLKSPPLSGGGRLSNGGVAPVRRLWSTRDTDASVAGSFSVDSRMEIRPKKVKKLPSKDIAQVVLSIRINFIFSMEFCKFWGNVGLIHSGIVAKDFPVFWIIS